MILQSFGTNLKKIRKERDISQALLAERTGLMREQISRIETGLVNPTLETTYKISVAFNMPLKELFDFEITKEVYKIKPFVKWAGGKTQLLNDLINRMPKTFNNYFEPFVGGGAVFINMQPSNVYINDFNNELMTTYACFTNKDKYQKMIKTLLIHEANHSEEYYYDVRALDRDPAFLKFKDYQIAARFIYLNKACFNGLYRVNAQGYFNVPSGKKKTVKAYDEANFEGLFKYLSQNNVRVLNKDFAEAVKEAKAGDFVYFDPPYDTFDEKDSFTSYSKDGFGKDEQERLAHVFKELDKKGVKVMLSNHNTAFINKLYAGFNIEVVEARRAINANPEGRGKIEEVIITNYKE